MNSTATMIYVMRHGRTALSAAHRCAGNRRTPITLDATGIHACRAMAGAAWLAEIAVCVTSRFPRTIQTADLLLEPGVRRVVAPGLDEIDYGNFETQPWQNYGVWLETHGRYVIPPGGTESLDTAVRRMLAGLLACLREQGPRLVVAHGLLVSVLYCLLREPDAVTGLALPEAPYLQPLCLPDGELRALAESGLDQLAAAAPGSE